MDIVARGLALRIKNRKAFIGDHHQTKYCMLLLGSGCRLMPTDREQRVTADGGEFTGWSPSSIDVRPPRAAVFLDGAYRRQVKLSPERDAAVFSPPARLSSGMVMLKSATILARGLPSTGKSKSDAAAVITAYCCLLPWRSLGTSRATRGRSPEEPFIIGLINIDLTQFCWRSAASDYPARTPHFKIESRKLYWPIHLGQHVGGWLV